MKLSIKRFTAFITLIVAIAIDIDIAITSALTI